MPEEKSSDRDLIRARELEKTAEEVYRLNFEAAATQVDRLDNQLRGAESALRVESARADQAEANLKKETTRADAAVAELTNVRENLTRVLTELSDEIASLKTKNRILEKLVESEINLHHKSLELLGRISERH